MAPVFSDIEFQVLEDTIPLYTCTALILYFLIVLAAVLYYIFFIFFYFLHFF